jgi:polyhydroxyalkanoate synthesis regulator phasin
MQQEAWRTYLQLAMGVTEASRKRATKAARELLGRGGATAEQMQALAEDIVRTGMANREALTTLIRFELDRALGRVGLATAEQVEELTTRVRDLERQLGEARGGQETRPGTAVPTAGPATAPTAVAKKATKKVAKKAVKKAPAAATPEVARAAKASTAKATGRGGKRGGGAAKAAKAGRATTSAASKAPSPRAKAAEAARTARTDAAGAPDPASPTSGGGA